MSLGPPIKPAPPPPPPEWKPHTDPRFEVNTRTGALRTRIPPPPPALAPMKRVTSVLFLTELDARARGDNEWLLLSDFKVNIRFTDGTGELVVVPRGFVTDLASVPRLPIAHMFFAGRARRSAVLHDYLYQCGRSRGFADACFLAAMRNEEGWFTRFAMHLGVRLGGWIAYWRRRREAV